MSSNNLSGEEDEDEQDDLNQQEKEEDLMNIFEAMSQASNQQSIKSMSAIAMATSISKKALGYVPGQVVTLQVLKVMLVLLNLCGVVVIVIQGRTYMENIRMNDNWEIFYKLYNNVCASLHSTIVLDHRRSLLLDDASLAQFTELLNTSYATSIHLNAILIDHAKVFNDGIRFPLKNDPAVVSLSDMITKYRIELDSLQTLDSRNLHQPTQQILYAKAQTHLLARFLT